MATVVHNGPTLVEAAWRRAAQYLKNPLMRSIDLRFREAVHCSWRHLAVCSGTIDVIDGGDLKRHDSMPCTVTMRHAVRTDAHVVARCLPRDKGILSKGRRRRPRPNARGHSLVLGTFSISVIILVYTVSVRKQYSST
jgi:hypothetical protein